MSRCFPFPPPGYEKKLATDDPDLLKKEKRREKKHKKDKKDKEKKDSKEKREKSRSEGKHKEKKEKHRDKKKDKEKSETTTPDDKNVYGQFKGHNGETLHHNNEQNKDGKKPSTLFPHQNGDLLRNKIKVGDPENNFKFVQELDRRIRDAENGTSSQQFVVEGRKNYANRVEMQKTDVAGFCGSVAVPNRINGARINGATTPPPLNNINIEKLQEKGSDDKRKYEGRDKKMERLKDKSDVTIIERGLNKHIMKSDLVAIDNNLSARPLENSFLGVGNEGNLRKRKDMEKNGVSPENETRPNKMARPMSNISLENGRKLDFFQNTGPSLLDKQGASQNSLNAGSKSGPRVNGIVTSQPVIISARKPQIPSSPPVITNHVAARSPPVPTNKPQPNNITTRPFTTKPPPSVPNPIASHHQPPSLSSPSPPTNDKQPPKPPPAVVNKGEPPPLSIPKKKPPHPDTKYLNQILSVPKLDQWCGLDDQEWLFSNKIRPVSKKPPIEVQVWSEAKHIESVDVCALPYVIPY